jgi:two-component system sensor histidine kinase DesK
MSASAKLRLLPPDSDLGWTPYAWLIYLPIVFIQPAMQRSPVGVWAADVAGALVFLVTYFRGHWVCGRALERTIVLQVALGMLFTPFNTGAYVFFTYAASFAARFERGRRALAWIAAITAIGFIVALATHVPLYYWIGHGIFTPLVGAVNFQRAQVGRATSKLRAAHDEIEHLAAVAERERIARDLHDVLGHTLSLIVLKAELASKLAELDPARAAREIRDVESVSRVALKEVREAIRGYRPSLADELARARTLLDTARIGATIETTIDTTELRSRAGAEEVMALALREAVTNVVRHSGASRATIRAWRERPSDSAILEVADDGRGGAGPEGAGLRGMRERVEAIDGTMISTTKQGTRLTITIPLVAAASGAPA